MTTPCKRILYVDDDTDGHELLSYHLDECELIMAETLKDGLRLIEDEKFDLYVFDLLLPDGNALELCRQLRKSGQHTPIIILSGDVREFVKTEVEEAGAQMFVAKPVDHENLAKIILTLIRD
ncbi:MAG: response regulator [Blastocatellales bacterium]